MRHHLGARVRLRWLLPAIGVLSLMGCADRLEPTSSDSPLRSVEMGPPPHPVAEAGLVELAQGIPWDREAGYGFRDRTALRNATVGPLSLQELLLEPGSRGEVRRTRTWRFTVEVGGQSVSLLTVAWHEGRWQAVALGAAGLAKELSGLSFGKRPALLRAVHHRSSFLVQRDAGSEPQRWRYRPLASARRLLGAKDRWINGDRLHLLLSAGAQGGVR